MASHDPVRNMSLFEVKYLEIILEISIETFYIITLTLPIKFRMTKSSLGVCIIPFLEFLFAFNFVLTNNFDFASLLMNIFVLVFLQ